MLLIVQAPPVTHRWAGTMGFSDDALPLVGVAPGSRRIHVCGGTGHGLGFAISAAIALSAQLLDSTPLPAWIDVARAGALSPPSPRRGG
jgi:glycine/D-amino acid oxidase-like deaminating enzyme